jgi:hypothetical protein
MSLATLAIFAFLRCSVAALRFRALAIGLAVLPHALEAMPQGGTVMLEGPGYGHPRVQLQVWDTGSGFLAARLVQIVEPWYTTKPGGQRWACPLCRKL